MKNKTDEFSFMLRPSAITSAGVGVFALHDIASGTLLDLWDEKSDVRNMDKEDIPKELIGYCVAQQDGTWSCPKQFNRMYLAWYLNHSINPNASFDHSGKLIAARDIQKDEEITIDYDVLNEPNELREDFYKK